MSRPAPTFVRVNVKTLHDDPAKKAVQFDVENVGKMWVPRSLFEWDGAYCIAVQEWFLNKEAANIADGRQSSAPRQQYQPRTQAQTPPPSAFQPASRQQQQPRPQRQPRPAPNPAAAVVQVPSALADDIYKMRMTQEKILGGLEALYQLLDTRLPRESATYVDAAGHLQDALEPLPVGYYDDPAEEDAQ